MENRKQMIFLVEENENVNAANRLLFEREGYMVQVARTIAEARNCLAGGGRVDLSLLDIDLPDGDGLDFLPELRELTGGAPVLVVSGKVRAKACAIQRGAQGFLRKPYRLDELCRRVRELVPSEVNYEGGKK